MLREGDMVEVYDPTRPEGYRVRDIRQVLRITPTGLVRIAGDPGTRWVTTWVLGDPAIVARPRNPHGPAGVLRLRLPTRVAHFRELARMIHAEALAMGEAGAVCRDITQRPVAYLPRWRGWRRGAPRLVLARRPFRAPVSNWERLGWADRLDRARCEAALAERHRQGETERLHALATRLGRMCG